MVVLLLALSTPAQAADVQLSHQGRLVDALGDPVSGQIDLTVSLWTDAASTELAQRAYTQTFTDLTVDGGYFAVDLGSGGGLDETVFDDALWVELQVDETVLSPRSRVSASPVAVRLSNPQSGVPSGAVMPFDLASCPEGWSTYAPAQGRFIRGLDPSGTVDPDGATRTVGSIQDDDFAAHTHESNYWSSETTGTTGRSNVVGNGGTAQGANRGTWISQSKGGDETRPDNVALLYCRKD